MVNWFVLLALSIKFYMDLATHLAYKYIKHLKKHLENARFWGESSRFTESVPLSVQVSPQSLTYIFNSGFVFYIN